MWDDDVDHQIQAHKHVFFLTLACLIRIVKDFYQTLGSRLFFTITAANHTFLAPCPCHRSIALPSLAKGVADHGLAKCGNMWT